MRRSYATIYEEEEATAYRLRAWTKDADAHVANDAALSEIERDDLLQAQTKMIERAER